MDNKKKKQVVRLNSLLELELYQKLKIKLIMQNKTLTRWIEEKAQEEIGKE